MKAFSQLSKPGSLTSFAIAEQTSQVHISDKISSNLCTRYQLPQAAKFNAKLSSGKVIISSKASAKVSRSLPERSQSFEFPCHIPFAKTYRPKCYERLMFCSAYTLNVEDVADDKIDRRTLYDVLGVSRKAQAKDIKAAYRLQARRLHPDVAPLEKREESATAFLRVHAAYLTLADPHSRANYDFQLSLVNFQTPEQSDTRLFGRAGGIGIASEEVQATATESATSYPWARTPSSQWKGRNWETDQCW